MSVRNIQIIIEFKETDNWKIKNEIYLYHFEIFYICTHVIQKSNILFTNENIQVNKLLQFFSTIFTLQLHIKHGIKITTHSKCDTSKLNKQFKADAK